MKRDVKNNINRKTDFYSDYSDIYSGLPGDPEFYMHLEERIRLEDQISLEIQTGNLTKALEVYDRLVRLILADNDGSISFLYVKSYSYSLNMLCRRCAYRSGVPVTALHALAVHHITRINEAVNRNVLFEENIRMICQYTDVIRSLSFRSGSATVNKVMDYIFMNLNQEISLKGLADYCRLTPGYLSAVFKKETGQSVMAFVTEKKIRYACSLLSDTAFQIQEVAHHLGYDDVSYFTRVFRKVMGMTPSAYRQRQERNAEPEQPIL